MTDNLKELPPREKRVAAKVLQEVGYSTRELEDLFNGELDHATIWRTSKEATPDDLQQFETKFRAAISRMKNKGIVLVQKRLLELIPKERRIDQVVKAGEYLEGKSNNNTNIQVNNFIPILGGESAKEGK